MTASPAPPAHGRHLPAAGPDRDAAAPDRDADASAAARAARLEALLGDPYDPANPHGIAALAAADARCEVPAATEELLAATGLGAEFVPAALGGRLLRADLLAQVLRPVFRRDMALGFGYGITSLFATAAVWAAGTPRQRARAAGLLLNGDRVSIVHHELAHANHILRQEFTADPATPAPPTPQAPGSPEAPGTPGAPGVPGLREAPGGSGTSGACGGSGVFGAGGGYRLSGRKDVIMNAGRAGAYVVYARTAPARGPRGHSVFLLDAAALAGARAAGQPAHLPRVTTPGMRGGLFSGLEFTACPVPVDALVGAEGEGVSLALRTFQVNRCLIPAVAVAAVDTVLHLAVRAATEGRTAPVARRWHTPLAGAFADLLAADSMASVALRALSLLPAQVNVLAAAVKYVVPDRLRENLEELAGVLGGHRAAPYGVLDKLVRDLPVAGLGHAGTAACQAVIVPQLRRLAERSWFHAPEPPAGLFRRGPHLPQLDYRLLGVAGGDDFLAATLVAVAARLAPARRTGGTGGHLAALGKLADTFVGELRTLRGACASLPAERSGRPGPGAAVLADRYTLILAAAAVLGVWEAQTATDTFLADPAWAVLALTRIAERLGIAAPDLPQGCLAKVLDELIRRHRTGRGYDLDAAELTR